MKKTFDFQQKITFSHSIEIEVDDNCEEDYEEFTEDLATEMENTYDLDKHGIVERFIDAYGKENVTFIEDGSGEEEFECW